MKCTHVFPPRPHPTARAAGSIPGGGAVGATAGGQSTTLAFAAQRQPELFAVLRAVIDQRRCEGELAGQYLPLGSASGVLLRQSSESLAGRMAQLEQPLRNGQTWVVEIKRSSAPTVSKGFHLAAADVGATRKLLVGGVAEFGLTPASKIQ